MTERPILFSAPMVRAILAGTKTQTRRVVNTTRQGWDAQALELATVQQHDSDALGLQAYFGPQHFGTRCQHGRPGDRLWVREAHSIGPGPHVHLQPYETDGCLGFPHVTYAADGAVERRDEPWSGVFGKSRPSIHMHRWASRILLEIVSVRVERLQSIREADAIAEGIGSIVVSDCGASRWVNYAEPDSKVRAFGDARHSFQTLWKSINGDASWAASPWVWVIEFKRVQP